jgi:copper chaperone CopZ
VCAHAVRVNIEKLPGVESVTVSLNEGRAVIALKAGNTVTLAQLRQTVERNGFTPQEAVIRAEAEVSGKPDTIQLRIAGTEESFDLSAEPLADDVLEALRGRAGQRVLIEGTVPVRTDRKAAPVIQVKSVKAVKRP